MIATNFSLKHRYFYNQGGDDEDMIIQDCFFLIGNPATHSPLPAPPPPCHGKERMARKENIQLGIFLIFESRWVSLMLCYVMEQARITTYGVVRNRTR